MAPREGRGESTPVGTARGAHEELVPRTVQPQAKAAAHAAPLGTSASAAASAAASASSSASASTASAATASTSPSAATPPSASPSTSRTPSSSSADSPAAQAKAAALGVFAGRSRPRPRTLNAMVGAGSPTGATRATALSPLVEGAPSVAHEEVAVTVTAVEAAEAAAPVAEADRLPAEQSAATAESLLIERVLPLSADLAASELPPGGVPRDKSPAAASRVNEKLLERLLEEKLQGPKNWLEGIKNGLVISKPSSEPSGPFVGPCKSCVSRGKPLQLGQSDDVLLLDVRSPATTSTTTRSTEPASVPVA